MNCVFCGDYNPKPDEYDDCDHYRYNCINCGKYVISKESVYNYHNRYKDSKIRNKIKRHVKDKNFPIIIGVIELDDIVRRSDLE